jgi:hypothetical protein
MAIARGTEQKTRQSRAKEEIRSGAAPKRNPSSTSGAKKMQTRQLQWDYDITAFGTVGDSVGRRREEGK